MSGHAYFELVVPGEPRGQGRARIGRGPGGRPMAFKDKHEVAYRSQIVSAWRAAGSPTVDGYWAASVQAFMSRPKGHYRKGGALSAAGLRTPYPARTPDVDNVLKNVDALVKCGAVPDDRLMIEGTASKHWADPGQERLVIRVSAIGVSPDDEGGAGEG